MQVKSQYKMESMPRKGQTLFVTLGPILAFSLVEIEYRTIVQINYDFHMPGQFNSSLSISEQV